MALHQLIPTVITIKYIHLKHLNPSNHTNTVLSFDSSIDHIHPTINKNKITTYNQHQVSEIKHSHISYIHSQPINPTANVKTKYWKKNHQSIL